MIAGLIMLVLVGAVTGFFGQELLKLRVTQRQAIVLGAIGGLVGGGVSRLLLSFGSALTGAVIGAALLIWFVERWRNRFG